MKKKSKVSVKPQNAELQFKMPTQNRGMFNPFRSTMRHQQPGLVKNKKTSSQESIKKDIGMLFSLDSNGELKDKIFESSQQTNSFAQGKYLDRPNKDSDIVSGSQSEINRDSAEFVGATPDDDRGTGNFANLEQPNEASDFVFNHLQLVKVDEQAEQ